MDKLKIGDVLIMDGKSYVSMDMYQKAVHASKVSNDLAEHFLAQLTAIEVANENRKSMRVISNNLKLTGEVALK